MTLNKSDRDWMEGLYNPDNPSIKKAVELFPSVAGKSTTAPTVRGVWRDAGFPAGKRGGARNVFPSEVTDSILGIYDGGIHTITGIRDAYKERFEEKISEGGVTSILKRNSREIASGKIHANRKARKQWFED